MEQILENDATYFDSSRMQIPGWPCPLPVGCGRSWESAETTASPAETSGPPSAPNQRDLNGPEFQNELFHFLFKFKWKDLR